MLEILSKIPKRPPTPQFFAGHHSLARPRSKHSTPSAPAASAQIRALSISTRRNNHDSTGLKLIIEYGMIQRFPGIHALFTIKFFEAIKSSQDTLTKGFMKQVSSKWGPNSQSQGPSLELALADIPALPKEWFEPNELEIEDSKSQGIVWAVPKQRKSIESRWSIKIGAKNWFWKMIIPKYDIRICDTCGHHYQARHLCRNCYERVREETKAIRKTIEAKIGDNVEDKDVVLLYQNEGENLDKDKIKDKLLVEIPKERPAWFSKNLLQKTTTVPDPDTTTVTVQKSNLG